MPDINKIKSVVSTVGERYGIKNAYLFGSYAKDTADEDSDIDIIIDRGEIHDYDTLDDFHTELQDQLGKEIDILTTAGVKPKFFELIKDDRILLYGA